MRTEHISPDSFLIIQPLLCRFVKKGKEMRKYDWSKERVAQAVAEANCWFDCLDKLQVPKVGGNYLTLKKKIGEYGLDTAHFDYRLAKTRNGKHYFRKLVNRQDDEIFRYGAQIKTMNLKREYIRRVLQDDAHCEICGIRNWNGKELMFQIHHLDGNHKNHSLENLQLLCPNCHSQTDNYSNRKRGIQRKGPVKY